MTIDEVRKLSLTELLNLGEFDCPCGKRHSVGTRRAIIRSGAVRDLPQILREVGCAKPFLLSGHDTFRAGGEAVLQALEQERIASENYVFPHSPVKPTEETVGAAVMHFDYSCDGIVGIGSGVINDTGKLLARATGRPYINVATAPSMDGFASATSSMDRDGLKVSLDSTFAYAVIGDLDILSQAPMHMLQAGVGDMLAKYISLVEWRIARLLVGEYYCPVVAALVENARDRVVKAAPGLLRREPEAVKAVMEGLVIAGMAMKYAGLSRPASGMEHYFSHIWDMRSLAFEDARAELHGIQAGIGTLYSLKVYDYLRTVTPDREKALRYVENFSVEDWNQRLTAFIGPGAQAMIDGEKREGKYDPRKHAERLERIIRRWDEILDIIGGLPSWQDVYDLMREIGAPVSAEDFGYTTEQIRTTFTMTKDIRDKYIASRLLWDLGLLEEAADAIF
jgi:glycerol-1-phosphate dehydrogenase [NAD(P)+]